MLGEKEKVAGKNSRILYLDLLRIAAVCAVIIIHIACRNKNSTDVHTIGWMGKNFFNGFSRWGVGVFVMISGALFLGRDVPVRKIWKKHILRIALSFMAWSFVYSFVFNIRERNMVSFLKDFAAGHYHLWFLLMIIGMYAIVPLLRKITADEKLTVYFLALSFTAAFAVPEAVSLIRHVSPGLADVAQKIIDRARFHYPLGLTFYFVLGHYLSRKELSGRAERILLILGLAGFIITICGNYAVSLRKNASAEYIFGDNTVNVALQAVGVFVLFKKCFGGLHPGEKAEKIIRALSGYTFGVYLVHVLMITAAERLLHLHADSLNPFLSIPLAFLLVCAASFLVSAVLNRIPVVKKYFV